MNRTIFGDCRETLRALIAQGVRVQCCVTSPPYFGLRDYGHPGQIGMEKSPAEYVETMVELFRLVRELLTDDGVLWLNLGDSYAGSGRGGHVGDASTLQGSIKHEQECRKARGSQKRAGLHSAAVAAGAIGRAWAPPPDGLKKKNLIGIPWRVAFALQAAGWILRQDIIWAKPNPMPESVSDRCTKSHEYLFLFAKSERYYWDAQAMQEPATGLSLHDLTGQGYSAPGQTAQTGTRKSGNKERKPASARGVPVDTNGKSAGAVAGSVPWEGSTRNRRSVWTVPTKPYSGAHFAVFPPELIEPCILAGSRPGDLVLDPFMGSGTTAQVAQALGRQWIGCELNTEYAPLQQARTAQSALAL